METNREIAQPPLLDAADPRLHLTVERTELAHERTLLAWVRTVMGMITAGFVIDKGFAALHAARLASGNALLNKGYAAGMILTLSGTLLMIIVTAVYLRRTVQLVRMRGGKKTILSPDLLLSYLVILIGFILIYFMNLDEFTV